MASPLISIIVLNYNGLRYLAQTLPPLLELDYPNSEVIVVDNGSTDGSLEFLKGQETVRLLRSPRLREKNFACNFAIEKARGEYVLLLDNDALLTEATILHSLLERYRGNPRTGVIGLSFVDRGESSSKSYGNPLGYYFIKETRAIAVEELADYDGSKIAFPEGKGLFIRRDRWLEVGGYDDHLKFGGDDNDLGIKLWLMGYENFLYSRTVQIHLGLPERQDNEKYALKWKEMFYAHLYTIFKDYRLGNMLLALGGFTLFGLLKSIKQALERRHLGTFLSFFRGLALFIGNLPVARERRRQVQGRRRMRDDLFLRIRPRRQISGAQGPQ